MDKKCSECGVIKPLTEFTKDKGCKDGYRRNCRICKYSKDKKYRIKNDTLIREKRSKKQSVITEEVRNNREKGSKKLVDEMLLVEFGPWKIIKYIGYLKEKHTKYHRHYFEKECKCCGGKLIANLATLKRQKRKKITCNLCNETINIHTNEKKCASCNEWKPAIRGIFPLSKNRPLGVHYYCSICASEKNRKIREKPGYRAKEYEQKKERFKTDVLYKFRVNISCNIKNSLKGLGYKKNGKSAQILGCSIIDFKSWIESQFVDDMNWDNRKLWDLDHKVPISFAKTKEEAIELCHYSNYQPLWSDINAKKSNTLILEYLSNDDKVRYHKFIAKYLDTID